MFLFQQIARAAKPGCGLLCGKWMNLRHTVALSHSYHSNNSLRKEVDNTPFTGLVMVYKPLRKLIKIFTAVLNSNELPLLIYSITRTRQFPPLRCKCINTESYTQEKPHWNWHTRRVKEERPSAGMLGCRISGEANNSKTAQRKWVSRSVTHDWRLTVLQSPPGCLGRSGLTSEVTKWLHLPLNLLENRCFRKQNCSILAVGIHLKQPKLRFPDLSHCILLSLAAYSPLFRLFFLLYVPSCLS